MKAWSLPPCLPCPSSPLAPPYTHGEAPRGDLDEPAAWPMEVMHPAVSNGSFGAGALVEAAFN